MNPDQGNTLSRRAGRRRLWVSATILVVAGSALGAAGAGGVFDASGAAQDTAAASRYVPDAPAGVTAVAQVPTTIPAGGIAIWSHVIPYNPPKGAAATVALPSIAAAESEQPAGTPSMAQVRSEEPPAAVLRRAPAGATPTISSTQASTFGRTIDNGPGLTDSAPVLVSYTGPRGANILAWVIVVTSPVATIIPGGCQAPAKTFSSVPQPESGPSYVPPSNSPDTQCPIHLASHDNLFINANTGKLIVGFFTP